MLKRTAITIPEHVLLQVDQAAKALGESRSRFISRVLEEVLKGRRDAEITARLNALFGDPVVADEQRRVAADLLEAQAQVDDESW